MQVSASCSAPTVILALEPHECLLDDLTKQVTCKPAQLVLTKLAGQSSSYALQFFLVFPPAVAKAQTLSRMYNGITYNSHSQACTSDAGQVYLPMFPSAAASFLYLLEFFLPLPERCLVCMPS